MVADSPAVPAIAPPDLSRAERRFLTRLFTYGLAIRLVLALGLDLSGYSRLLAPDEQTYGNSGLVIAAYWSGDLLVTPWQLQKSAPLYYYLNGIFSYLLGPSVLLIKFLNCVIGAMAARFAYLIARGVFGIEVAQRAATLVMFMPSLVLWSTLNIRDVWAITLLLVIAWKSLQLVSGFSVTTLATLLAAIALLAGIREYLFWVVGVPPVAALFVGQRGRLGRNFVVSLLLGVGLVLLARNTDVGTGRAQVSLEALAEARRDLAAGGSAFAVEVDVSSPQQALAFLPIGLVYYFFSPFPWQINTTLKLLTLPEMLLIYYLTPSVIRGLLYTLRFRFRQSLQLLLMASLLACAYALVEGNVGTLYRHRGQALSFFLIFAAVGQQPRRHEAGGSLAEQSTPAAE